MDETNAGIQFFDSDGTQLQATNKGPAPVADPNPPLKLAKTERVRVEPDDLRKHVEEALAKHRASDAGKGTQQPGKPASAGISDPQRSKTGIVNLEKLEPQRDLIAVLGFAAFIAAVAHYNPWIALGIAGVCFILLSYLLSK